MTLAESVWTYPVLLSIALTWPIGFVLVLAFLSRPKR